MDQKNSFKIQQKPVLIIRPERKADEAGIERLARQAFGPGRFARAAFRLREGVKSDPKLSFVACLDENPTGTALIGSVKLTPILIGGKSALLLGPLITTEKMRGLGIGRELMNRALWAARQQGHEFVVLVGDLAYYQKFGFERVAPGRLILPGPADPARILACELVGGVAEKFSGKVERAE